MSTGAGRTGIAFTLIITGSHVQIELSISTSTKEQNKSYFDQLHAQRAPIEALFGHPLAWERLSDKKMSRVKYRQSDLNVYQEEDWPAINEFFLVHLPPFEKAFKDMVGALR